MLPYLAAYVHNDTEVIIDVVAQCYALSTLVGVTSSSATSPWARDPPFSIICGLAGPACISATSKGCGDKILPSLIRLTRPEVVVSQPGCGQQRGPCFVALRPGLNFWLTCWFSRCSAVIVMRSSRIHSPKRVFFTLSWDACDSQPW